MGFQIGNNLSAKSRPITDIISRIAKQDAAAYETDQRKIERLRSGLEKVFDAAATGDIVALTFLRDTVQGKPAQAVTVEDDAGRNVFAGIRMVVMRADALEPVTIEQPAQLVGNEGATSCG